MEVIGRSNSWEPSVIIETMRSAGVGNVQLDGEDADEVLVPDSREALDLSLYLFKLLPSC